MNALTRLTLSAFRGATTSFELRFEPDKRITVIYGENASGKSTICDGLEFLSRGKVGSLEDRGLGQTTRYWPALGRVAADVSVALDFADGRCTAALARNGEVVVIPAEAQPKVEVFRRSQILSLIEAKPGERYAAISRFIDVSGVESSEGSLRELIRDLKRQRDGAQARLEENEMTIRQFWESEGSPAADAFTWAEAEAGRSTGDVEAEVAAIRALQSAYSRLLELPARLRSTQQALLTAKQLAEAAAAAMQSEIQSASNDAAEVIALLEAANVYLTKLPAPAACPLCESSEHSAHLGKRIKERLNAFSTLQSAKSKLATSADAAQRAEQQLQLVRDNARQDVIRFDAAIADRALPPDIPHPAAPVPNSASALTSWLATAKSLAEVWKQAESSRLDRKQFVNTLRLALETWHTNQAAFGDLDRLLPRLEDALKIVEDERRRFTDDLLSAIAGEVSRLYDVVHPGEGLNRIHLELDPKKRASLEIGAHFCGQPTRPQGYFSESHLDTLGLCVFLALAALDEPESTVLVLDDVLSSVDDVHAERILGLLIQESARFRHLIVTTHSQAWTRNPVQYQLVRLGAWSAATGLTFS